MARDTAEPSALTVDSQEKEQTVSSRRLPAPREREILGGWLKIGVDEKLIVQNLGIPRKGENEYWGAIGTYVQDWHFENAGISLEMESEEESGEKKVRGITISSPCTLKTEQRIGLGSPEALVLERYADVVDKSTTEAGQSITVGTIYGGTIFTIEKGDVSRIYIGAAAE